MTRSARAVVSIGNGAPVEIEQITIPDPGPGDVVARVLACGVCHSDIGAARRASSTAIILGHETAVIVEEVGEGVTNVTPGDFGVVAWRAPCGTCRSCRRGDLAHCLASRTASRRMIRGDGAELGAMLGIGGFADRTLVSAAQVVPVNASIRPEVAALIGCGVMTGFGAAVYAGNVQRGDVVAVFGCGGVGDAAIAGASFAGAAMVIAVDINPQKLEWARRFGATHFVDGSQGDAVEQIAELTDGRGADVSIEAVGSPEAYLQAFYAHSRSGTFVQVGVPTETMSVTLPLRALFDRGPVRPSHYGDCIPTRDFPVLIDLYQRGRLDLESFVSETIALEDVPRAFERLERGEVLRSVVVF